MSGAESISIQVQGGRGEPERLLVLSRVRDGRVEVREFRFGAEDEDGPREYSERADVVLGRLERAHHERRRLSEDMHSIRRWLGAQP